MTPPDDNLAPGAENDLSDMIGNLYDDAGNYIDPDAAPTPDPEPTPDPMGELLKSHTGASP